MTRRRTCLLLASLLAAARVAVAQEAPAMHTSTDEPEDTALRSESSAEPRATPSATTSPNSPVTQQQFETMEARIAELESDASARLNDDTANLDLSAARLTIYGFADVGYDRWFLDGRADDEAGVLRPTPAGSFVFGNLNMYFDAELDPKWQTLIELRFTLAPHGEETSLGPPLGASYERIDTTAFDFSSASTQNQLRLGSLFIERAYTEWKPTNLFRLRAGVFLNPFGIWNVDHGTPTLIALALPTFVAGEMMPARLLGLQALGSYAFGNKRLEYSVHLSNGRTPLNFDLSDDKALGARLALAVDWQDIDVVLGASAYYGTYVDKEKVINLLASSMPGAGYFDWKTTVAYREFVWGVDLALHSGGFRLCLEGVARWIYYENGRREPLYVETGEPIYSPDRLEWDAYVIAAYRLPWQVEPYVMAEASSKAFVLPRFAGEARLSAADRVIAAPSFGINLYLTARVKLKAQAQLISAYDAFAGDHLWNAYTIYTRLVSSF